MLPAVVLLAVVGVWAVLVGTAQLRCTDAAGVGARALARGEPADEVRRVVAEVAPRGARVELDRTGRARRRRGAHGGAAARPVG